MANIPKIDGNFELEVNDATQSYEDTLYTDNKNISGNIHIHITSRDAIASMPSTLEGTDAITSNYDGSYITLTKNLTNTASISTSGWISSLSGSTTVSLTGKIPSKRFNIPSTMMGTSYYYKIMGEANLYIYKGGAIKGIELKDTIINLYSIANSTGNLTLNYRIVNINGTASTISWLSQTLEVNASGTDYGCFILTNGEISFSLGAPTSRSLTTSTTLPSPYALNTSYRTASTIRLYCSASYTGSGGGTTSAYKWIDAPYFNITSITRTTDTSGYSANATIKAQYSSDGITWTSITCTAARGGSSSSSVSSSLSILFYDIVDDIVLEPDSYV